MAAIVSSIFTSSANLFSANDDVSPSIDDPWGGENGSIRDFLHNELKPWIHSTFGFSQDPSFNVVLGISMGAYEALKWAIDCPNDFNKIALFSGVYDFNLYNPNEIKKDRIQFVLHKLIKPQIDKYHKKSDGTYSGSLFQEIEKLNNNLSVYIYCQGSRRTSWFRPRRRSRSR